MNGRNSQEDGVVARRDLSRSPRPRSRIEPSSSSPDLVAVSRQSRSHTLMYPPGSSPDIEPMSKPRSPTYIDHLSPKFSPKRSHGSFDSNDFVGRGPPSNSHTLSQLRRSQTTKLSPSVYGKNMWDDDEYVDTGGNSAPRTPTGGAAARRINQQRKNQAQTVKLPDNPFVEADYADMTGHQRNENGMEKLRTTHQYKSMKVRSPSASKIPLDATETDGIMRHTSDASLTSRDRNFSISSSRSGSQSSRLKRSDTSPVFRSQSSVKENYADVQRDGSMRGGVQPVIQEVEGISHYPDSLVNGSIPSPAILPDRQGSLAKSTPSGLSPYSTTHAPSPAHSAISTETATTILKPSTPGSPAVMYKNSSFDGNPDNAHVAIVVDETMPTSPMYAPFAAGGSQKSADKSTLKFEAARPGRKPSTIALITLAVLIILALLGAVAALVVIVIQQSDEIGQLKNQVASLQQIGAVAFTTRPEPTISATMQLLTTTSALTPALQTTKHSTTTTPPALAATTPEPIVSTEITTATSPEIVTTKSTDVTTASLSGTTDAETETIATTSRSNSTVTNETSDTTTVSLPISSSSNSTVTIESPGTGNNTTATTTS